MRETKERMNKFKSISFIAFLTLCLAIFAGLIPPQTAQAQDQAPPAEQKIELNAKYPVRPGPSDTAFQFDVDLQYTGGEKPLTFELSAKGPQDWTVVIQKSAYDTAQVSAIRLDPTSAYPETVTVAAVAPFWLFPEPGDYTITMEAASGSVNGSIDLTARITARYSFTVATATGQLNINAKAGQESHFSVTITNTGTDTLNKITFSSSKPEEWSITFKPENIEALRPLDEQEVEVTVKPASKTIAGDYMTTLTFNSDPNLSNGPPNLEIRVTVSTPTTWGWIGVGIVLAVIAGIVFGFRQLGRR
jgi:uncharacterized membrane protein